MGNQDAPDRTEKVLCFQYSQEEFGEHFSEDFQDDSRDSIELPPRLSRTAGGGAAARWATRGGMEEKRRTEESRKERRENNINIQQLCRSVAVACGFRLSLHSPAARPAAQLFKNFNTSGGFFSRSHSFAAILLNRSAL